MSKLDAARQTIGRGLEQLKGEFSAGKMNRNDPCYCGSGKKYKQCHMAADRAVEQQRREQVEAAQFLRRDLLKFARDERFHEPLAAALPLYWNNLYELTTADEMSANEAFRFFDWFIFDYQGGDQPRLFDVYRAEKQDDLATSQQNVLAAWGNVMPAAAYYLDGYEGQTLQLRDFISDERYTVFEAGGHGDVKEGDLILARLVPVADHLEFSVVAAYIPQGEVADLAEKMASARAADAESHADADHADFLRRHNHLFIHHALQQAELQQRPPVARLDPKRSDSLVRGAAQKIKKMAPALSVPVKGQSQPVHDKSHTPRPKV
jgi:hypothetical protein